VIASAAPAAGAGPGAAVAGRAERPALHVALGTGVSFDEAARGTTAAGKPFATYSLTLGAGSGGVGVSTRLFSNAPAGGTGTSDVQRLAVEGLLVLRPAAFLLEPATTFVRLALRSLALEVGPAFEELVFSARLRKTRVALATGAHVELPLFVPDVRRALALRVGVRRLFGPARDFEEVRVVKDSALDLFAALALRF
jgi:Na+/glutamate symporter